MKVALLLLVCLVAMDVTILATPTNRDVSVRLVLHKEHYPGTIVKRARSYHRLYPYRHLYRYHAKHWVKVVKIIRAIRLLLWRIEKCRNYILFYKRNIPYLRKQIQRYKHAVRRYRKWIKAYLYRLLHLRRSKSRKTNKRKRPTKIIHRIKHWRARVRKHHRRKLAALKARKTGKSGVRKNTASKPKRGRAQPKKNTRKPKPPSKTKKGHAQPKKNAGKPKPSSKVKKGHAKPKKSTKNPKPKGKPRPKKR